MATIASLSVLLGLDAAGVTAGGKQAQSVFNSIAASAGRMSGILTGALTALAGGAIIQSLSGTAKAIDETGKLADRLNITTEALVGLKHAADVGGLGAETMTRGIEMMTKNLGQMVVNGGGATEMLARFGLDVTKLAQMAPDQAFIQIAEAVSHIQNPAERAAVAVALFGKSGQQLLNVLSMGSSGLQQMREDVEALGGSFSRVEAAKVEEANDAITRLGVAIRGMKTEAIIAFAPMVTGITNFVSANHEAIFTTVKWTAAIAATGFAVTKLIQIGGALVKMYRAIAASQAVVMALTGPAGITALIAGLAAGAIAVAGINAAFDSFESKAGEAVASVQKQTTAIHDHTEAVKGASGATMTWAEMQASIAEDVYNLTMELEDQIATFGMTADAITLMKLAQRGATDEQLASIDAGQKQLQMMKDIQEIDQLEADFFNETPSSRNSSRMRMASAGTTMGAAVEKRFVQGRQNDPGAKALDRLAKTADKQLKEQVAIKRAIEKQTVAHAPDPFDFPV